MCAAVAPPPTPGDPVGPYTLKELLGVGGMATVYRATDDTGSECAVKILHPGKAQTEELKRFRREFLALRDLRHPNVVQVHEAGAHNDYPWIAMEYVDGQDLGTLIERWTSNPPQDRFIQVERLFRGLCQGLAYVHEQGLIHRDLKPSNVLVTRSGEAKLTDFGVVKAPDAFTTQLTIAGKLVGTVAFMSPEQITGEKVTDRSDLYSLGAVLYMMLTLRRPIEADNIAGYLARHITETPRQPSEIAPDCPPHLERICMHLLEKEAGQRPGSTAEVIAVLEGDAPVFQKVIHGRDDALGWLAQRLGRISHGGGSVAIIVGPDGAGRTALLEVFVKRARAGGFVAGAVQGGRTDALLRLRDTLPGEGDLNSRIRRGPCALVIDDMDQLTIAELQSLSQLIREAIAIEGLPILVAGSVRSTSGLAAGICTGADTGLSPDHLDLCGINRDAAIRIIRDQGVSGALAAALGRRLVDDLNGAPGGIVEQIAALVQAGWLVPTPDGGLRAGRPMNTLKTAPLPLPDRVQHKHAARIKALPDNARAVFETLVVVDMEVTLDLVGEIAQMEPGPLSKALHSLTSSGMVVHRADGVHEVVGLANGQYRDVAYALIPKVRRGELHRAVAHALRKRNRRRTGTFAEVIAAHLLSGGQVGEAYPMLLMAAQGTLRGGNLKATTTLLDKADRAREIGEGAMASEEATRCRRRLFTLRGMVLLRTNQVSGALEAWRTAIEAAREEGDAESIARAQAGLGLSRMALGETEGAAAGLEHALAALPQGDPMWADAAEALAQARLTQGDIAGAKRLWADLLDLGKEMGEGEVHARAMVGLGIVSMICGDFDRGRDDLENAVFRMRDQTNRKLLPEALMRLGELAWANGNLEQARKYALEADGQARESMQILQCVSALGLAAQSLYDLGQAEEASRMALDAAALARAQGTVKTVGEVAHVLSTARVLTLLGQYEAAQDLLPASPPTAGRNVAGVDDPVGGLLAIKSRIVAARNPVVAVALARQVLDRAPAALPWATVRHLLDATHTLMQAKDEAAPRALQAVDLILADFSFRRLNMEAALLADAMGVAWSGPTPGTKIREELDHELGSPQGFMKRWTIS